MKKSRLGLLELFLLIALLTAIVGTLEKYASPPKYVIKRAYNGALVY